MPFLIKEEHLIQLHILYSEPNRYYHNMNHVSNMISYLNLISHKIESWQIIACYYHDAIYDVTQLDNEEQSFRLFHNHFLQSSVITPEEYFLIKDTILGTKLYFEDVSKEYNTEVLKILDADLAPLAAERDIFIQNNKNIRREKANLIDEEFILSSITFCENMLKKKYIYNTQIGKNLWDYKARINLEYALNNLQK